VSWIVAHRFLLARRTLQIGILALLWLGASRRLGWLVGDLSASTLFGIVPLADPFAVLQILATGASLSTTVLVGAAIVLAFYAIAGGRSFCAWVCPLNPVTDLAASARRRFDVRGRLRVERHVRYWVLALSLVLSAVLGVAAFEWVSPIGMLHRELVHGVGFGVLAAAGIFALDLFVLRNGWCSSLCPLGAFWGLVGRVAALRIGFEAARCDRCNECVRVCPEPQVIRFDDMAARGLVDSGDCLNCARCIEVCPRDALGVTLRPFAGPAAGPRPRMIPLDSRRRSSCDAA
jgi:ferredoxin-type protein NapH